MNLSQFGGSNLEESALERALRKKKFPARRERPVLTRGNCIGRDDDCETQRKIPPRLGSLHFRSETVLIKSPREANSEKDAGKDSKVNMEMKDDSSVSVAPQVVNLDGAKVSDIKDGLYLATPRSDSSSSSGPFNGTSVGGTPNSPTADAPFAFGMTTLPFDDNEEKDDESLESPSSPNSALKTNSRGEKMLDVDEVRKYFGYPALRFFNQKINFVHKQKNLQVRCPPLSDKDLSPSRLSTRSSLMSSNFGRSGIGTRASTASVVSPEPSYRPQSKNRSKRLLKSVCSPGSSRSPEVKASVKHDADSSFLNDNGFSSLFGQSGSLLLERKKSVLNQKIFSDVPDIEINSENGDLLATIDDEVSKLKEVQSSPRSAYIMGCLNDNLNPRGSHIVRKKITEELHLEHFGMGDDLIEHLAASLQCLPHVTSINISDNNLTDWGLVNVLHNIVNVNHLLILDMSHNKIGTECAQALASFLASNPPLQRLILQKTDIDDFEGEMFVKAIHHSTNLVDLDLSMNELGNQEVLNSVRPNTTTAPEELADLLTQPYCPIQELKLAWNVIRLDSAISLSRSLAVNSSLIHLDLSYNGIGPEGGRVLGEALFENSSLQTLLLANNNIDSASCFIICTAIQQNYTLSRLGMDGNPIGVLGAKSLMHIPTTVGSRLALTAEKCNVLIRSEENNWFDEEDPCGSYDLDMKDTFSRAVAFKLLSIAAHHYSYAFKNCYYSDKKDPKEKDRTPIVLEQKLVNEKINYLTEKEKKVLENLQKIRDSSENTGLLRDLFVEYDMNRSGTLEHFELKILFEDLGMPLADKQLENAMRFIDVDCSGSIDLPEFISFIHSYREDVNNRIRDMTEGVVMGLKHRDKAKRTKEDGESQKFIPPKSGILHMELFDTFIKKPKFNVITETDCSNIITVASNIGHLKTMIGYSLHSSKLRFDEALKFYDEMLQDVGNKAEVLLVILPRMLDPTEARALVSRVTNEDPVEIEFVRQKLGNALNPIFGTPCGFYRLDLSKLTDRVCLVKLFEFGIEVQAKNKSNDPLGLGCIGDTSQWRNWSAFRNDLFNGEPYRIVPENFSPMMKEGILEFDYAGYVRPSPGFEVMSDAKLTQVLINTALLKIDHKRGNLERLQELQAQANSSLQADGKVLLHRCDKDMAAQIGEACEQFYQKLPERSYYLQEGVKKEDVRRDFMTRQRRKHVLDRQISKTNEDELMTRSADDDNEGAQIEYADESFVRKFNEFLNRPLGEHQQKLLEKQMESAPVDDSIGKQDDISGICGVPITRRAVYVKKDNKRQKLKPKSQGSSSPDALKLKKNRSKKGGTITLPSIVVKKEDKEIVLPALTIPRCDGDSSSGVNSFQVPDTDVIINPTKDDALYRPSTRASILDAANLNPSTESLSADYHDHQKRIQLMTKNRRRMRQIAEAYGISTQAKASRLFTILLDYLSPHWMKCRHVANVLNLYYIGAEDKAEYFGTYRVELVVSLFSKIVDMHNFDLIFRELVPKEQGYLYCRLGWLNLFNPTRPEGCYELNMELWEERMVAKCLLALSLVEDGGITEASFQWNRKTPCMPGWMITKPWMSDSTMQRKGILSVTYGPTGREAKFRPNPSCRKSLLHMVLSREEDMVPDDASSDTKRNLAGLNRLYQDKVLWMSYFYGDKDTESKITRVGML